jgi:hypothetical protein
MCRLIVPSTDTTAEDLRDVTFCDGSSFGLHVYIISEFLLVDALAACFAAVTVLFSSKIVECVKLFDHVDSRFQHLIRHLVEDIFPECVEYSVVFCLFCDVHTLIIIEFVIISLARYMLTRVTIVGV